jgi:hypothetical protein
LLFLLNAACLAEKQQIPILVLVWPDQGSNPRSTALEVSTLTKSNPGCWSSTKRSSSSSHWKLACSRHDIAEKLLSWH